MNTLRRRGALGVIALFILGGTIALGISRAKRQPVAQAPSASAVWKRNKKSVDSFGSNVSVNLVNFPANTEWIVGASALTVADTPEASVGIAHWNNSGGNSTLRAASIDKIDNYPDGFVDITTDAITIRGSEALVTADKTVIVYLKLKDGTQVHLTENGNEVGLKAVSGDAGFGVKNGTAISLPVRGASVLLTYLQAERIAKAAGVDPKEVKINVKN